MADIKDRAREYLAKNSEYNEVYGEFFVAVDTMTAMIEFAEQETKELKEQIEKMKEIGSEMYVLICDKCESRNCAFCSVKEKWQMFKE